jgi:hypothetical protein
LASNANPYPSAKIGGEYTKFATRLDEVGYADAATFVEPF